MKQVIQLTMNVTVLRPLEIHKHLLCLGDVEQHVVLLAPPNKVIHPAPVLILTTDPDTLHNGSVIRELLLMTDPECEVHTSNRSGDSTVPWGAPVLLPTLPGTQPSSHLTVVFPTDG